MTAELGFRADDQEMPPRRRPKTIDPDPKNPIQMCESRSWVGTQGNLELVTEDEILEGEIASRSKPNEETADAKEDEFEHPAG